MSYTYLLESGEESSAECYSDIPAFVPSKSSRSAEKSSCNGNATESSQNFQSGTMCERFDERMSALVGLGVRVFLSCEPLLGYIDISAYAEKIDWVIVGGENAPLLKCRQFDSRHANKLLRQAQEHNIPYFFKSTGKRHNFYDLNCKSVSEPMATREYAYWHSKR